MPFVINKSLHFFSTLACWTITSFINVSNSSDNSLILRCASSKSWIPE